MTIRRAEVIVGVSHDEAHDRDAAIAQAAAYLSYADHSDTVATDASIYDVSVVGGDRARNDDWGIGLYLSIDLPTDESVKAFMDSMARLARVETVEWV